MKKFAIAAAVMAGCLIGTAQATAPVRAFQQVVRYSDLNLESKADAAILLGRIESAARKVCGLRRSGPMPLEIQARLQMCADDATARAVADVNAPQLTRHSEIAVSSTVAANR